MPQIRTGGTRAMRVALPLSRSGVGLGTDILTTEGTLPVEYLEPGDKIITRDRGAVPLARVARRHVPASAMLRLRPDVLDPGNPARAFLISDRQQIVLTGWRARALFGKGTALVEAARLVDGEYLARVEGTAPTRLYQLIFADGQHVLPLAGGTLLAASARIPARTQT